MANAEGIVGYGVHIPRLRIKVEEIAKVWGADASRIRQGLNVDEKAVADFDEDTLTIAVEASRNALSMSGVDPMSLGAIFIGSESHPYAVNPTASKIAAAISASPRLMAADYEFACKAGTAAMQTCLAMVRAKMIDFGLAIGADTAQGRPGDALEYTAGSGGAAFLIGAKDVIATIDHTVSFTTDTPDFWRRGGEDFPSHGARFTGEPAYFRHVVTCTNMMLEETDTAIGDFDYVVFHMPNGKFPLKAAKMLGVTDKQILPGFVVKRIGNTYSGQSPLGLASVLDVAKPGERVLVTSYGSGAGSDSFSITVTDQITESRGKSPTVEDYINNKEYIQYGVYAKHRRKLKGM